MTKHLILIILAFSSSLHAQIKTSQGHSILGTWKLCDKITDNFDQDLIPIGTDSAQNEKNEPLPKETYTFNKWGHAIIEKHGWQRRFSYRNMLRVGDTIFIMQWLTRDTLILEYTGGLGQNTIYMGSPTLILCRTDSIGNVNEKIQSGYPNGQKKFSGQKIGDKLNGIWKERYENGNVKSVAHYKEDILLMKIEFDKNGKIISKTYY